MTHSEPNRRAITLAARGAIIVAIVLIVALRLVSLHADAYPRLSWSSGLLTDEGFYIHNARNIVLFGRARTDEWNNMLIMPTLHFVQVGVFRVFGVGAIQARMISVVASLLALCVFYAALRQMFAGGRVAMVGTALLGLDHVNLLYNRMALMDTPASLPMVCALYAFARGVEAARRPGRAQAGWMAACGAAMIVAYATRGVGAFLLPAPFLALRGTANARRPITALLAGCLGAMAIYLVLWYLPHHAELTRLNAYYLREQLLPRSLNGLRRNLLKSLFGDEYGIASFLFRHTPVTFVLALAGLLAWPVCNKQFSESQRLCLRLLGWWLALGWASLALISYPPSSPSRYYVLFYPAMMGIAAVALFHAGEIWMALRQRPWMTAVFAGYLGYHLMEAALHHDFDSVIAAVVVTIGVAAWLTRRTGDRAARTRDIAYYESQGARAAAILVCLWAVVNTGWTGDWLASLTYHQRDADRWLSARLPPDSVLFGDVAPGLCLDNHLHCVNVIPKLCNDDHPIERFAPAPRVILILDDARLAHRRSRKERWWMQHYPTLVATSRRWRLFTPILRPHFAVGVYMVPGAT